MLDIHHKRELYELIDGLPLEREHEKIISISGLHTIHAGIDVLVDIYESFISAKDRVEALGDTLPTRSGS